MRNLPTSCLWTRSFLLQQKHVQYGPPGCRRLHHDALSSCRTLHALNSMLVLAQGITAASTDMSWRACFERHKNVYLYIPNVIGYLRIILTLGALAFAFSYPEICVGAYFLAFVCDELDGRAARTFNQTSMLGGVLDMVTDRVATTGLLALLCSVYPQYHIIFILLITLDIFSHWFQMYSTLLAGSSTHKDVHSRSWLVRLYYRNRIFMGFCCICCEVEYLALFMLQIPSYQKQYLIPLQLPKLVQQLAAATTAETIVTEWQGLPVVGLVALLALPGVLVKQLCNWVQLRAAVQSLVAHDVKKMS